MKLNIPVKETIRKRVSTRTYEPRKLSEDDKEKILKELEENLKKDRSKTQVIGFTPLDLLEMTRKHMWSND